MISNPRVGMRVKYIEPGSARNSKIGIIIDISNRHSINLPAVALVQFDNPIWGINDWQCDVRNLYELSPEEQLKLEDQNKRQAYADKYL